MRFLRPLLACTVGASAGIAAAAAITTRMLVSRGDAESDDVALVAIFDGVQRPNRSRAFRPRVVALLDGIAVRIPAGWRVESSARALLGGIDVRARGAESPDALALTVPGLAVLGGMAIGAPKRADAN